MERLGRRLVGGIEVMQVPAELVLDARALGGEILAVIGEESAPDPHVGRRRRFGETRMTLTGTLAHAM